jgi:hypothetical protein
METLAFWRNIALVILALEGFLVLVLVLALNYGLVRLMDLLHRLGTRYLRKAQGVSRLVAERTETYADKAAQPVVAARAQATWLRTAAFALLGRRARPPIPPPANGLPPA